MIFIVVHLHVYMYMYMYMYMSIQCNMYIMYMCTCTVQYVHDVHIVGLYVFWGKVFSYNNVVNFDILDCFG